MEIWKQFKNYPVEVSNYGRVKCLLDGMIITPFDNGNGYQKVRFPINEVTHIENQRKEHKVYKIWRDKNGLRYKVQSEYVHRMVAIAFIPNPENKPQIDHIDTDRRNNCVDNLRWVTPTENSHNPITNQKMKESWTNERREKTAETMKETNKHIKRFYGNENSFSKKYKGTHYYNNGIKEDRFKDGEQPDGWERGGLKRK